METKRNSNRHQLIRLICGIFNFIVKRNVERVKHSWLSVRCLTDIDTVTIDCLCVDTAAIAPPLHRSLLSKRSNSNALRAFTADVKFKTLLRNAKPPTHSNQEKLTKQRKKENLPFHIFFCFVKDIHVSLINI